MERNAVIVKEVRDGRQFGDRKPETKTQFLRSGETFRRTVSDSWEGPGSYDPDDLRFHPTGQYVRITREERL